jgi:hypothetical protein
MTLRLANMSRNFARIKYHGLTFEVISGFGTTTGGRYVAAFMPDSTFYPSPNEGVKEMFATSGAADSPYWSSSRIVAKVGKDVFYTNPEGVSSRWFSPGSFYVLAQSQATSSGSLTVTVTYDVEFSEPVVHSTDPQSIAPDTIRAQTFLDWYIPNALDQDSYLSRKVDNESAAVPSVDDSRVSYNDWAVEPFKLFGSIYMKRTHIDVWPATEVGTANVKRDYTKNPYRYNALEFVVIKIPAGTGVSTMVARPCQIYKDKEGKVIVKRGVVGFNENGITYVCPGEKLYRVDKATNLPVVKSSPDESARQWIGIDEPGHRGPSVRFEPHDLAIDQDIDRTCAEFNDCNLN